MIAAVAPAASTDDEMPHMYGVGLEVFDGELHARATNGQWAMRVKATPLHADPNFRVLVPMPHVRRLLALIGDGAGQLRIERVGDLVRFEVEKIGRLDLFVGGVAEIPFVDIEKAWPTNAPQQMDTIGLNPSLMASLAKAFGAVADKPTLRFAFHGTGLPIVVTCEENEDADALLMPCTLEGQDDDEPEERQTTLFPESEKAPKTGKEKIAAAMDGILHNPGGTVTVGFSGGKSVTFKGTDSKGKPSKVKKVTAKPKASKTKKKK